LEDWKTSRLIEGIVEDVILTRATVAVRYDNMRTEGLGESQASLFELNRPAAKDASAMQTG
jgi:hypothetical protein